MHPVAAALLRTKKIACTRGRYESRSGGPSAERLRHIRMMRRSKWGNKGRFKMYKTSAGLFLSAILLSMAPARAKSSLPTHTASITIAATGSDITGSGTGGACGSAQTSNPWVDHCSADTGCTCIQFTPTKVSKGNTVTDFFVTIDSNLNPAVETTVDEGPIPSSGEL